MREVCRKYPPTIVVDDGSHRADHVLSTFECVFPLLLPGGCYVIEDLHFHLSAPASSLRGEATTSPPDYFSALTRALLAATVPAKKDGQFARNFVEWTDRVIALPRAMVIWKRDRAPSLTERIALLEDVVGRSRMAHNWQSLAELIIREGGPLDCAELAARKAVELGADRWASFNRLSDVLERRGDLLGAIDALRQAQNLAKGSAFESQLSERLGRLERKLAQTVTPAAS